MTRLKLVSTKITDDLVDRLERYTQSIGLTQSAIIRKAIGHYLDKVDPVDSSVDPVDSVVDPVRSEIDAIKDRLTALEKLTQLTMVDSVVDPVDPITVTAAAPIVRPHKCPRCGSAQYRSNGKGQLRSDGSRGQRLKCVACDKGWIVDG